MKNYRGLVAVIVGLAVLAMARVTLAQEFDGIAARLAKAREVYERQMDRTRDQIEQALQEGLRAAARGDKDAFVAAQKAVEAFASRGKLPDHKWRDRWTAKYAADADRMRLAYQDAIAKYATLTDAAERAAAVQADLDIFSSSWDMVPWGENLLDGRATAERTVSPGGVLVVEAGLEGAYRLDISATRAGESGTLFIEFPLVSGERVRVPALPDARGDVRVLLTVAEGHVCVDLGLPLPVDVAVAGDVGSGIAFTSADGVFEVETVAAKAVVDGTPPKVADAGGRTSRTRVGVEDLFPVGSEWTGVFTNLRGSHTASGTVLNANGSSAIIRVRVGDYGTRDWHFSVRGKSLVLKECRIHRTKHGVELNSIHVDGRVQSNKLYVSGTWTYQGRTGGNERISLTLTR